MPWARTHPRNSCPRTAAEKRVPGNLLEAQGPDTNLVEMELSILPTDINRSMTDEGISARTEMPPKRMMVHLRILARQKTPTITRRAR